MPRSRPTILLVSVIVLLGFALRIFDIDGVPLRGDEAFALAVWTGPLGAVLRDVAPFEPQPPLVFASMGLWVRLTGDTPFALRTYSLLWSVLTIAPLYQLGRSLHGRRTGLLAALLWATSPAQIWHAQDSRNYALWAALSVTAVWLLLVSLRSGKWQHHAAYVLLAASAAYAFYLEAFVLVFHNAYALWRLRRKGKRLAGWLVTQMVLLTLLAPWYLQLPRLRQGGYSGTGDLLGTPQAVAGGLLRTLSDLLFGELFQPSTVLHALAIAVGLASLMAAIVAGSSTSSRQRYFLTGYALIPLVLFLALSTTGPLFRPRYLNGVAAAYLLGLAALITSVMRTHKTKWLPYATLAAVLTLNTSGLANYYFDPAYAKAPNWPALTETLQLYTRAEDITIRNVPDPAFDYYYSGAAPTLTLPPSPDTPASDTQSRIDRLLEEHARVWFLPTDHPVWDPDNVVDAYLTEQAQLVIDTWVDGMRVQRWSTWEVQPDEISHETDWEIGGLVRVVGFDSAPTSQNGILRLHPGEPVTLIVYWEPLATSGASYTAFSHLTGPARADGSTLWAGHDHLPQQGHTDTTTWTPGELLRDAYILVLPEDAPAGTYTVSVGLYASDDGSRLPVTLPVDAGDSIPLLTITVQED